MASGVLQSTFLKISDLETVAVMFVDQTLGGTFQKKLQHAEDRVAEVVGYRGRVVEQAGTQLCRLLSIKRTPTC